MQNIQPLNRQSVEIIRRDRIADAVVFVGGLPACGKSLLTAIVGSLERVEMQRYNYTIEHLCSLYFLGKLGEDVVAAMIRMQTDLDLYNLMMGRETNFRFKDCSSIFKNPKPWRYLRRLFYPGGAEAVDRIKSKRPILHILTHNVMMHCIPLALALEDRFHLVEMVRHPLYMIKQWYLYIERYGKDPRDFNIWYDYNGHSLPFFAKEWEDLYVCSNAMDKTIYGLERSIRFNEEAFQKLPQDQKAKVLIIPFEKLVTDPLPYLRQIEKLLGTRMTVLTRRELKKQKVPRKRIGDGVDLAIYREYGWQRPEKGSTERMELEKQRQFAAEHATPAAMKVLDHLCETYEKTWGLPF